MGSDSSQTQEEAAAPVYYLWPHYAGLSILFTELHQEIMFSGHSQLRIRNTEVTPLVSAGRRGQNIAIVIFSEDNILAI